MMGGVKLYADWSSDTNLRGTTRVGAGAAYWDGRNDMGERCFKWSLFLSSAGRQSVAPAEDGDSEIVSNDHRIVEKFIYFYTSL